MLVLLPTRRPLQGTVGEIRSCAPHASSSLRPWVVNGPNGFPFRTIRASWLDFTVLTFGGASVSSPFVRGLKCRLCGQAYPISPTNFCTEDFGPLEVDYDYEAIAEAVSREKLELRPNNMWRYQEFLPLDGEPTVGRQVGGTPLVKADRLAAALGVKTLWLKN